MNLAYERILSEAPWESLMKRIFWLQLGNLSKKKILDFGSGLGKTACYLAKENDVTAIEPNKSDVNERWTDYYYGQIIGSVEQLKYLPDSSFDVIICHNVLEYIEDREAVIREFERLLKPDGFISVIKHNRPGRIMQMVTLLNNFEHASELLDGLNSVSSKYGTINYYNDEDITGWGVGLSIVKTLGIRTFWDLQQNQEIHSNPEWQEKMIEMDLRVSDIAEYKNIAFFHHLFIKKTS